MLPVTIITGFLGSGKTTLLNRLLQHSPLKNSLVVINEFGEVGIDHLIVSAPAENVRLLANGCLCCQIRGDMIDTLTDVSRKRQCAELPPFDRVLIETTGLADPVPILQTIVSDADLSGAYRLDSVIAVIDALHGASQLESQDEARKQVAVADVLLLSKTDLADPAELPELKAAVERINSGADLLTVAAGAIDPQRLFQARAAPPGLLLARWLERLQDSNAAPPHRDGHRTFALSYQPRISEAALATWLSMLASFKAAQLLRVKGIVNVAGEPYIINAVQSVIHEPLKLDAWPTADESTRIVFIVRGMEREAIERTFSVFAMADSLPTTAQFDPAAYGRFREAAESFIDLRDVTAKP